MREARRYARAIFELAGEEEDFAGWSRRLGELRRLTSLPEIAAVLSNPTIPRRRRAEAADGVASPLVGGEAANLIRLLILDRRLDLLGAVIDEYERMLDQVLGRVRAVIVTAVELGHEDRERIRRAVSARLGIDILADFEVDPGILGGFVVRVGDRMIDASVRSRLEQLRRWLANRG